MSERRYLTANDMGEIQRQLGELRGEVRGMLAAISRLARQIDEHLVVDEKAHARQDQRIVDLLEAHARAEGGHEASLRWGMMVGAIIGVICGLVGPILLHLMHL